MTTPSSSLRRRLLVTLAPATLLVLAVTAFAVGRTVRTVVGPLVTSSSLILLNSLADEVAAGEVGSSDLHALLQTSLPSTGRSGFVVVDGDSLEVIGSITNPEVLAAEARRLLGNRDKAADVLGFGPVQARVLTVARAGPDRLLILEHRLHGLWTPFTVGAIGIAAGVLVLGIASAFWMATMLYRPLVARLQALDEALVAYGHGDTGRRIAIIGGPSDELDQVHLAFNKMADRIAELELQRADQIRAERALLADLAHDINTPITVLRGYAETLLDREGRLDDKIRHQLTSNMLGQSLYVQAIVEDLLTMASARSAELAATPQQLSLDELFDALVDSFQPMAAQRGCALLGDADGLELWADPVRLRQILTNLVRNALLHAEGARVIELGAHQQDGGALVWVRDDGGGVPEATVPHLFDRHAQGDSSTAGWGLGLTIVRTLAELHGGWARYEPLDPGARFEVWLPGPS